MNSDTSAGSKSPEDDFVRLVAALTGKVAPDAAPARRPFAFRDDHPSSGPDLAERSAAAAPAADLIKLVARLTGRVNLSKRAQRRKAARKGKRVGRPPGNVVKRRVRPKQPRPPAISVRRCLIAAAMTPGRWYGRPQLRGASGLLRNSLNSEIGIMKSRGLLVQAPNPAWVEPPYPGAPREPIYLFSLSSTGETFRRFALAID